MYNLLIAIAAAVVAFLFFFATGLVSWWGSVLPSTVALLGTYYFLMRRTFRELEAIVMTAQKDLAAKRWEPGIAKLKEAFPLAKWQFFVAPQINAQIGMIYYMLKRFDEAKPFLELSFVRIAQARAMLGALYFQRKDYASMSRVFEEATKHSKKDGFLWSIYAFCLDKAGEREKALAALSRGLAESPEDEKLKANQLALQNKERMKMKAYGNEWWMFHLEAPPRELMQAMNPQLQQRKGYRVRPS